MNKKILFLIMLLISSIAINAQIGWKKDSLQIKVYTDINYTNSEAQEIKVRKVFCDYCTDYQSKVIEQEAINRAEMVKNDAENRLSKGIKRLALYIRVSKIDFAALKEDEDN